MVKSAQRTTEVLELFSLLHRPASVGEISRALGYPQSSTSVLLKALASLGYLEQDPVDRTYRPTLKVMLLGGWAQDRLLGEGSLLARLEELRRETGLAVLVAMRWGVRAQYLIALRPANSDPYALRAGMTRPIGRASVGKALLMLHDDAEVGRILRRANLEEPDLSMRVSVSAVLADLRESRERGWTESRGAVMARSNTFAMPMPPIPNHPPLAIGIGTRITESDARRPYIVAALRSFCAAITQDVKAGMIYPAQQQGSDAACMT